MPGARKGWQPQRRRIRDALAFMDAHRVNAALEALRHSLEAAVAAGRPAHDTEADWQTVTLHLVGMTPLIQHPFGDDVFFECLTHVDKADCPTEQRFAKMREQSQAIRKRLAS